jgi:hypothetical protein
LVRRLKPPLRAKARATIPDLVRRLKPPLRAEARATAGDKIACPTGLLKVVTGDLVLWSK